MTLRTERLVVDRLRADDVAALVAFRNDDEVAADQTWPMPYTEEAAAALIASSTDDLLDGGQQGIRLLDGTLIGDLHATTVHEVPHSVEVGLSLGRGAWGYGYGAEVMAAVIDELLGTAALEIDRIVAYTFASNRRSQALFASLGFRREAHVEGGYRRRDGALTNEVHLGYPRSLWRHPGIELTAAPHPADRAFLDDRIYEFNAAAVGRDDGELLAVTRRDDRGRIEAGLDGWTWAGVGHVDVLWVREDLRNRGIGEDLLRTAEAEMRRRGCGWVYLESHTFQAPAWYVRLGYEAVAEREPYPLGHGDVLLRKRL